MVQGSPGYGIQYDEKGNIIRFQRAPSDGTTLTFYSNGGLRSFRVELAEKKYFEAEWSSEGKLIKEEIGAYPSIYFPQKK